MRRTRSGGRAWSFCALPGHRGLQVPTCAPTCTLSRAGPLGSCSCWPPGRDQLTHWPLVRDSTSSPPVCPGVTGRRSGWGRTESSNPLLAVWVFLPSPHPRALPKSLHNIHRTEDAFTAALTGNYEAFSGSEPGRDTKAKCASSL